MNFISVFRNSDSNHSAYFRHKGSHFGCEGLNSPEIDCIFAMKKMIFVAKKIEYTFIKYIKTS